MLEFVWMTRAEYSVTGVVGTLPYGSNTLLEGGREREREEGDGDFCSSLRLSCSRGLVSTTWLDSCSGAGGAEPRWGWGKGRNGIMGGVPAVGTAAE
jgi:hypothetical protein